MIEVTRVGLINIDSEDLEGLEDLKWALIGFSDNKMTIYLRSSKVAGALRVFRYQGVSQISAGELTIKEGIKGTFEAKRNGRTLSIYTDKEIAQC